MCNPISLIITEDKVFLPPDDVWNHSHSFIMKTYNIPDGLIGDKYLRLEVIPPEINIFRDKETNEKLKVNDTWKVKVDEKNIPEWYSNDLANQEDRAREAAKKWFKNFPDNLLEGYKKTAANYSTLISGDNSTLTAGDNSTLTAGNSSKLTAGYWSTLTVGDSSTLTAGYWSTLTSGNSSILTAGNFSTLTAGNSSTLTAGNSSILTAGDSSILTANNDSTFCAGEGSSFILHWNDEKRRRTAVAYVGENGIEPNTKYHGIRGKFIEVKE